MRRVGKYEVGRTIGEGTFAKVKFAIHKDTADCFAIKVLDKDTVLRNKMVEQVRISDFFFWSMTVHSRPFFSSSPLRSFAAIVCGSDRLLQ